VLPQQATGFNAWSPTSLYNGMIAPLVPFAIKGAIWYQGESNASRAYQYRRLFPAMIQDWRKSFKRGDFPFYFVQIAPFKYGAGTPSEELREAQFLTLKTKNTGMAVTWDIGNIDDIHPRNKQDVGKRLALWALAKNYDRKNIVYSGPLYKSMKVEGDKIRLSFNHVGSGLVAKDGPLTHFTIAGKDKKFVPADAVIDGKTIVVSSSEVKRPAAVRFAWSNTAEPNLFNKEGLPASSFRTDNWPAKTRNNK
jgi:sialate O-acetylesterase